MPPIYIVIIEMPAALNTINRGPPMAGYFPSAFLGVEPKRTKPDLRTES
jgi:hypothetical protein